MNSFRLGARSIGFLSEETVGRDIYICIQSERARARDRGVGRGYRLFAADLIPLECLVKIEFQLTRAPERCFRSYTYIPWDFLFSAWLAAALSRLVMLGKRVFSLFFFFSDSRIMQKWLLAFCAKLSMNLFFFFCDRSSFYFFRLYVGISCN